jgi:hypothetical protein
MPWFDNYLLDCSMVKRQKPSTFTLGLTNRTEDNYFVPFLDYDKVEEQVIYDDIDFLQKNFDLGTALVIVSSDREQEMPSGRIIGNYHIIFFTKLTFPECREVIDLSRCDYKFKKGWRFQQRAWVLRVLGKKGIDGLEKKPRTRVLRIVKAPTTRVANRALIILIEKLHNLRMVNYFKKVDKTISASIIEYPSK